MGSLTSNILKSKGNLQLPDNTSCYTKQILINLSLDKPVPAKGPEARGCAWHQYSGHFASLVTAEVI